MIRKIEKLIEKCYSSDYEYYRKNSNFGTRSSWANMADKLSKKKDDTELL